MIELVDELNYLSVKELKISCQSYTELREHNSQPTREIKFTVSVLRALRRRVDSETTETQRRGAIRTLLEVVTRSVTDFLRVFLTRWIWPVKKLTLLERLDRGSKYKSLSSPGETKF